MGANDESEQTSEGAGQRASTKPLVHRGVALGLSEHEVARVTGKRAEVATLQAQLRSARERGDIELERVAATKLARRLVATGSELDQATRLARRSLLLGEDPQLREELSSWFASLGRLALAAGTLEPLLERQLSGSDRARLWTRIAVLRARANEAEASATALHQAAKADRADPLALELFAAMRAFAPQVVSRAQATDALIVAANLREGSGDERASLEDLLQALNINPAHLPAAERMARHLTSVGRPQAADEVWRRVASNMPAHDERTLHVHRRRIHDALAAQLPAVALGAALDTEADRELNEEAITDALDLINDGAGFVPIATFDGLLHCLGLTEWLLARALRVARRSKPETCAALTLHCARVLSGPLGHREQLPWLLGDCLLQLPAADDVFAALSEYATTVGDLSSVVEVIVAMGCSRMDHPATHRRLEQLAFLSERELRDPSAGVWALEKLAERAPLSGDLADLMQRLASRVEPVEVPQTGAWKDVPLPELRRLIDVLGQRPGMSREYSEALTEMCERDPEGIRWFRLRERLWWSQRREADVQQMWQEQLNAGRLDAATCRLGLLRSYRRADQVERILQLMTESGPDVTGEEAASYVVAAGELGSDAERVFALGRLAETAKPAVASVLWAYVSELMLRRGNQGQAVDAAERACRADQHCARAFVACAEALGDVETRIAGLVFERASRLVLPRVPWCKNLARIAARHGNPPQRLKWLRRWASLAPLDTHAAAELLSELSQGNDAEPLEAALDWLLGQPRPRQELLVPVCEATLRLVELAPGSVGAFARRLIGVFGLADERLVQALQTVAERTSDHQLAVAIIERRLVFAPGDKEQAALLLLASEYRAKAGEPELAVDCLMRALELGAAADDLVRRLDALEPRSTSDAYLQELTIRLAAARLDPHFAPERRQELELELGLGYRDLASDKGKALSLLLPPTWVLDEEQVKRAFDRWVTVFGVTEAVIHLRRETAALPVETRCLWSRAACFAAHAAGEAALATELGFDALLAARLQTDVLAVLEAMVSDVHELERAYQLVLSGVLGVYGERALHYRAACEFERRGDRPRALKHAEGAFLAVPGHGIAFALMSRLAQALDKPERVAEVMREASEMAPDTPQREYWALHASSVAESRVAELRERIDLLLRALAVRADVDAVRQLSSVVGELTELAPEQRVRLRDSFDSAIRVALRGADGVMGAATAWEAVAFAQGPLADEALALSYRALTLELDPTHPDLLSWVGTTPEVNPSQSQLFLRPLLHHLDGGKLLPLDILRFGARLAENEKPALAAIVVALAVAQPQDVELLARARKLASNDAALLKRLEAAVPPLERALAIIRDVDAVDGAANQAARLDASVRRLASHTEWFGPVFECLRRLADSADAREQVEGTLEYLVNQEDIAVAQRAEAARLLATLLTSRGAHVAALEVFARLSQWRQMTATDQRWAASIAQLAGDEEQELAFLGQWELRDETDGERANSVGERVAVLARIAELHAAMGSRMQARHYYERVLLLSPGHETAERFLLDDAERTEDYSVLAARLEEQLVASQGEPSVAIKLSQIYVQRLNAPDKAQAALELALRLYGDDEELLSVLGELLADLGQAAAAATLYQKLARGSRQHHRASQFAELACRSYLRAGLDDAAREILSVKGLYPNTPALAELRVELARKQGNDDELVLALEELAVISKDSAVHRAQYLLEASETALHQLDDLDRALALAERGARMAPGHLALQLFARMLQYRKRGVGSRQDALYTITELRSLAPGRVEEQTPPSSEWPEATQAEVRAFLLAEALAKRSGASAGLKELREVEKQFGPLPLVDLAIGERLAQSDVAEEREQALTYLERALAGDFRQLRSRDQVALDAAMLALKAGQDERAMALALRVEQDSDFGASAQEIIASIGSSHPAMIRRLITTGEGKLQIAKIPLAKVALKQVPASMARFGNSPPSSSRGPASQGAVTPSSRRGASVPMPDAESILVGAKLTSAAPRHLAPSSSGDASADLSAQFERGAMEGLPPASTELDAPAKGSAGIASQQPFSKDDDAVLATPAAGVANDIETNDVGQPRHHEGDDDAEQLGLVAELPVGAAQGTGAPVDGPRAPASATADDQPPSSDAPEEAARDAAATALESKRLEAASAPSNADSSAVNLEPAPSNAVSQPFDWALASDPFAAAKDELQRLESRPPAVTSPPLPSQRRAAPPPKPGQTQGRPLQSLQAKAPPKRRVDPTGPSVVVSRSVIIGPQSRPSRAAPPTQPPPSAERSLTPNSEVERALMTALTAGSVGAGRELLALLQQDGSRTRETLAVCRLLAYWSPGDERTLSQLRDAAKKDNDPIFARALLHAQRVLQQPERSPVAPPLHRQTEHAESMVRLLAGPPQAGCEALGVLWQHLPELFRQDRPEPSEERRVEVGGGSVLGELVLELSRLFGCPRVGVYEAKRTGEPEFELLLTQPAALILRGDVSPDSPHFRFQLGRMLFATRPEYALSVGLEADELRLVLGAIGVGFGPPRRLSGDVSQIAHLAERFWEMLPPHIQRRLSELCEQPQVLEPSEVVKSVERAMNRAGLFACGDLGVAIREVASAEGIVVGDKGLSDLCRESEGIADLVRLATSLEYADARWRSGATRSSTDDAGMRAQ